MEEELQNSFEGSMFGVIWSGITIEMDQSVECPYKVNLSYLLEVRPMCFDIFRPDS